MLWLFNRTTRLNSLIFFGGGVGDFEVLPNMKTVDNEFL